MDLAGIVVASLSALGSLVQAYYSAKVANKNVPERTIKNAEKRAAEPLKVGAKQVDDVIDDHLLAVLNNEIEKHNSILIEAFRTENITQEDMSTQVENARVQICKVLSEIMRFNKGKLPTERLKKLWVSNGCKKT
ncbi:hypothetical protein [Shewanella putrefaciens]|uniref:hypothetical protein n=1 Tax=Shewanella putrefaciens TaxID=24 RepID=UPI003D7BD4A8